MNEKLTKVKEGFLIDFTSRFHNFFYDQAMFHWWMNVYITEDEVLGINLVDEDYYYLDLVIKQNPKDKEFVPDVKTLKPDLPVRYWDVY